MRVTRSWTSAAVTKTNGNAWTVRGRPVFASATVPPSWRVLAKGARGLVEAGGGGQEEVLGGGGAFEGEGEAHQAPSPGPSPVRPPPTAPNGRGEKGRSSPPAPLPSPFQAPAGRGEKGKDSKDEHGRARTVITSPPGLGGGGLGWWGWR